MNLDFHSGHLMATYNYLCAFKPFAGWALPEGEIVVFRVITGRKYAGLYDRTFLAHRIGISSRYAGAHITVLKIMAHEMIHLKQAIDGTENKTNHNAVYKRLAAGVCREWGWDIKDFYL